LKKIAVLKKLFLVFFLLIAVFTITNAQKKVVLSSPDGRIKFEFELTGGHPLYAVRYNNKTLIDKSALGLTFIDDDFFRNELTTGKIKISDGIEDYALPAGKTGKVREAFREITIPLQKRGSKRIINVRARVFNDGLGFRYEFPQQENWNNYTLTEENTAFNLTGNPKARVGFLQNHLTSFEHRYSVLSLRDIRNDTLIDMPALFEFPEKIFLGITEANLLNYAGMSLIKRNGIFTSQLSPLPGQSVVKVKAILPHHTPWRVLMISDRIRPDRIQFAYQSERALQDRRSVVVKTGKSKFSLVEWRHHARHHV
jgi:alpha-glucosidase